MRQALYIIIGCISVVLGIIGVFIPGLPTTPFLLLSSWLFYKSSKRLHDRLHRSLWLGTYLRRFENREGIGWKTKLISIVCMWTMIFFSVFYFIEYGILRFFILFLGVIGTTSIFIFGRIRKKLK